MKYLLLIVVVVGGLVGCDDFKSDYWEISLTTKKVNQEHMDSSTAYHFYEVDKFSGFSDMRIDNTYSGFSMSHEGSYEKVKAELIENALKFRKGGEPVYFLDETTGKRIKIK